MGKSGRVIPAKRFAMPGSQVRIGTKRDGIDLEHGWNGETEKSRGEKK